MKQCPVCKARCFDDMAVCYGCLYDFSRAASSLARDTSSLEVTCGFRAAGDPVEVDAIDDIEEPCGPECGFERVDPPWFTPLIPASPDRKEVECEAFMSIPMVTVVRPADAGPRRTPERDEPVLLEVSIPAGGRVLLRAR